MYEALVAEEVLCWGCRLSGSAYTYILGGTVVWQRYFSWPECFVTSGSEMNALPCRFVNTVAPLRTKNSTVSFSCPEMYFCYVYSNLSASCVHTVRSRLNHMDPWGKASFTGIFTSFFVSSFFFFFFFFFSSFFLLVRG